MLIISLDNFILYIISIFHKTFLSSYLIFIQVINVGLMESDLISWLFFQNLNSTSKIESIPTGSIATDADISFASEVFTYEIIMTEKGLGLTVTSEHSRVPFYCSISRGKRTN